MLNIDRKDDAVILYRETLEGQPRRFERHRAHALDDSGQPWTQPPVHAAQNGVGTHFDFSHSRRSSLSKVEQDAVRPAEFPTRLVDKQFVEYVAREIQPLSHRTPAREWR
jgi:hypothetical protein